MSEHEYLHPVEDQDELDAVPIEECGEPLVDFLGLSPKLTLAPKHPVFDFPRVHVVRQSVAYMLRDAANQLPDGMFLEIVEGYRPIGVQRAMFRHATEEARKRYPGVSEERILLEAGRFSAPPDAVTPPPHLTGGAVDVNIVDEAGTWMDFISPYELTDYRHAHMDARGLSEVAARNRGMLREILEPTGLTNYADEWWHWSYGDNGWALRTEAPCALYDRIDLPKDVHWIGNLDLLPEALGHR